MTIEVARYYDDIADRYDDKFNKPYWKIFDTVTWKYIREHLPESKDALILDAGGGTGHWAIPIAKLGYRVILVDISEGMLKQAQKNIQENACVANRISLLKRNIENLGFPKETFDLILAQGDVVGLCQDSIKALGELSRVLIKGGRLLTSVTNKIAMCLYNIPKDIDKALCFLCYDEYVEHVSPVNRFKARFQTFTPMEIKQVLEDVGLRVEKIVGQGITTLRAPEDYWLLDQITEDQIKKYVELELRLCEKSCLLGFAPHLLVISIKPFL